MADDPLMTAILEELAHGRIDAVEAARRIDALKGDADPSAPTDESVPSGEAIPPGKTAPPAPNAGAEDVDSLTASTGAGQPVTGQPADDPWAAATDRPQHAGHPVESVTESPPTQPQPKPAAGGVERISVRVVGRRVRIVGETSVAALSAEGPHVLRRNGAVLEVTSDGEIGPSFDGFSILRGVPRSLEDVRALGLGKELLLRVNPAIVVDVEVTAGNLNTERVPRLGKVRVTAGGARLLDVTQVNDVLVQAGSATIKGSITHGRHRVRAESGSLSVTLGDDSNVTIKSEAQLGRVSWSGGHSGAGDEVVMGNGNARLDVEVVMGHAQVRVGSDTASPTASAS